MKKLLFSALIVVFNIQFCFGQSVVAIEDITSNPGSFHHERVVFEGFITRYVAGTASTSSYYEIQGDYGARIRVNTSESAPKINARYRVVGTITIYNQEPLVIETNKSLLEEPPVIISNGGGESDDNTMMIVIIIGLVVIAGLIIFFLNKSRTAQPVAPAPEPFLPPSMPTDGGSTMIINKGQSYDTIKFESSVPATMKFIPGKLEIINGPDKGKAFMLAGYPTPDGSVSSIGRDYEGWESALSGGRKYAHIRIKDESKTLSRMQAEIVYKNGKVFLKNLSSVNPSQVDGCEVPTNETMEIKTGSVIKAGFIEFRYNG
jgi:hypothetical protein